MALLVKMETWVNMLHLLTQLQKKLQPDLKTNTTQSRQKIELHGSPATKDLKKPHSSRWVEEAEMQRGAGMRFGVERWWNGQFCIHVWWIKSGGIPSE